MKKLFIFAIIMFLLSTALTKAQDIPEPAEKDTLATQLSELHKQQSGMESEYKQLQTNLKIAKAQTYDGEKTIEAIIKRMQELELYNETIITKIKVIGMLIEKKKGE